MIHIDNPIIQLTSIRLDFRAKTPLYLQLAEQLRDQIAGLRSSLENGPISHEAALPPVRLLAQQLGINFNTVARAYRVLDIEGWISARPGQGTHLTPHFWPQPILAEAPQDGPYSDRNGEGQNDALEAVRTRAMVAVKQPPSQADHAREGSQRKHLQIVTLLAGAAQQGITPQDLLVYLLARQVPRASSVSVGRGGHAKHLWRQDAAQVATRTSTRKVTRKQRKGWPTR